MNRREYLLTKLQEECAEVAQRAAKQIQFGANQVQKAGEVAGGLGPAPKEIGLTNAQRLFNELMDLAVIAELLEESGELPSSTMMEDAFQKAKEAKIAKMNKYIDFSRSLGLLEGDWKV
jgi:hypothetical protein